MREYCSFSELSHKRNDGRLGAILAYLLHLRICNSELISELMITEGNITKKNRFISGST
jgi:hypothetical protein